MKPFTDGSRYKPLHWFLCRTLEKVQSGTFIKGRNQEGFSFGKFMVLLSTFISESVAVHVSGGPPILTYAGDIYKVRR